jgi:hypothetical protein
MPEARPAPTDDIRWVKQLLATETDLLPIEFNSVAHHRSSSLMAKLSHRSDIVCDRKIYSQRAVKLIRRPCSCKTGTKIKLKSLISINSVQYTHMNNFKSISRHENIK